MLVVFAFATAFLVVAEALLTRLVGAFLATGFLAETFLVVLGFAFEAFLIVTLTVSSVTLALRVEVVRTAFLAVEERVGIEMIITRNKSESSGVFPRQKEPPVKDRGFLVLNKQI